MLTRASDHKVFVPTVRTQARINMRRLSNIGERRDSSAITVHGYCLLCVPMVQSLAPVQSRFLNPIYFEHNAMYDVSVVSRCRNVALARTILASLVKTQSVLLQPRHGVKSRRFHSVP